MQVKILTVDKLVSSKDDNTSLTNNHRKILRHFIFINRRIFKIYIIVDIDW